LLDFSFCQNEPNLGCRASGRFGLAKSEISANRNEAPARLGCVILFNYLIALGAIKVEAASELVTLAEFLHSGHDMKGKLVFRRCVRYCGPRKPASRPSLHAGFEFIQMLAGVIQGELKAL